MSSYYNRFNTETSPYLDVLKQPVAGSIVVLIFITLLGNIGAQITPPGLSWLHTNYFFRVLVCFLLLWINNQDPFLSLIVAGGFVTALSWLSPTTEPFEGPETAILPSCLNLTTYDLLDAFNGNKDDLINAMVNSRVPLNLTLADENAGLIGTYLVNYNYPMKASSGCGFPSGEDSGSY